MIGFLYSLKAVQRSLDQDQQAEAEKQQIASDNQPLQDASALAKTAETELSKSVSQGQER